jgi:hypothetical protein
MFTQHEISGAQLFEHHGAKSDSAYRRVVGFAESCMPTSENSPSASLPE